MGITVIGVAIVFVIVGSVLAINEKLCWKWISMAGYGANVGEERRTLLVKRWRIFNAVIALVGLAILIVSI